MTVRGAQQAITTAVKSWEAVTVQAHRFGGVEYVIGRREVGHVHGDQMVDIPFPKKVRDAIVAEGRAQPHHILPETGWVSFYVWEAADIQKAISLLAESYEIARKQKPNIERENES
jgi:hypothetical protein